MPAATKSDFQPLCTHCGAALRLDAKVCPSCGYIVDAGLLGGQKPYAIPPDLTLSVIMPVYNEEATVKEIIRRVQAVQIKKEIIVVDDGSTDGTPEVLKGLDDENVKVILHERNRGKGAAIRTAQHHLAGDIVIIQDADLEYNPEEYYRLIEPIVDGRADVVYGSRFIGDVHRVHLFWHYVGNKILTTISNMFNNLNLTDMETCYKVFKADVFKRIELQSDGFGFEPEVTAKVAKRRCRIYEMPISYSGRDYAEGKKIGWKDAVSALADIVRFRFFDE
jgi:glycosyltransferase involved in cell wall biosynthesis